MQRQGLLPNVTTYNALTSAYEKGKQPEQSRRSFSRSKGISKTIKDSIGAETPWRHAFIGHHIGLDS